MSCFCGIGVAILIITLSTFVQSITLFGTSCTYNGILVAVTKRGYKIIILKSAFRATANLDTHRSAICLGNGTPRRIGMTARGNLATVDCAIIGKSDNKLTVSIESNSLDTNTVNAIRTV